MEDARPNEHLSAALDEARRNALEFRRKATEFGAEAEKWEEIERDLEATINKSRTPAQIKASQKARGPVAVASSEPKRAPRGYWWLEIRNVVEAYGYPKNSAIGPTKRFVIAELKRLHPACSEPSVIHALNKAINSGALVYRVDYLYLPDNQPEKATA